MNEEYCSHCNPDLFVLYGYCTNCGKKCNHPLFDPHSKGCFMSDFEWEEYPEYLTYEELQAIKNGKLNFIAKPLHEIFNPPHNPF